MQPSMFELVACFTCMHTHKHINTRSVLASLPPVAAAASAADAEPGAGAAQVTNFQHVARTRGSGRARGKEYDRSSVYVCKNTQHAPRPL